MASATVWIAVPDGVPDAEEAKDPYTTRIGGAPCVPSWTTFEPERAVCGVCGYPMCLLLQAYCPRDLCERMLLVFCCNTSACHTEPSKSWQVWRFQRPIPDDDEEEEEEEEDDEDEKAEEEKAEEGKVEETNEKLKNSSCETLEEKTASKVDDKNSAATSDTTPDLQNSTSQSLSSSSSSNSAWLPCFALDMFEEPDKISDDINIEAELRKMEEINNTTDSGILVSDLSQLPVQCTPSDKIFMSFQTRMLRCPQQVVRWAVGLKPLWIAETDQLPVTGAPPCEACGAPRTCELQLMPTLIYALKPYNCVRIKGDYGVDFGTATVYTCSQFCSNVEGNYCPEYIHLQPPPLK